MLETTNRALKALDMLMRLVRANIFAFKIIKTFLASFNLLAISAKLLICTFSTYVILSSNIINYVSFDNHSSEKQSDLQNYR